ncbi:MULTISPECIES: hypothetical protein [unclassified Rhizobacter]|uniref:hypothetical protein n=1 Tax=unclassified Rhizobacter TaxID=2640088 RepID=UPI0006F2FE36|nr:MULTISPECIES: hypothetical protein [unclassified Rhizobacter]KQU71536.1 hypothetical protein ASC88_28230 [Rhizobacter sp. Root29]KQV99877.1 hypothetical protein ASC98_29095 [Rhizobacter sp. Root1238]KRB07378.1 hypothetical protein ASE08_29560 [Rhizobacter sp. Root16D2]
MKDWTQLFAAVSLCVSLAVVKAMGVVMDAFVLHVERRAERMYLQAQGLALSLARAYLRHIKPNVDPHCPACRSGVQVAERAVAVPGKPIAAVVDVSCRCGLCNSRFGMPGRDEDELN